jgi:putative ABC transport system permease protein
MTGVLGDDIVVENVSGGPVSPQSVARVAAVPGVETVTLLRESIVEVNGEPTRISIVDPAAIGVTLHLNLAGAKPGDLATGVFVVSETALERGWSTGDELTLQSGEGASTTVRITAVLPDAPLLGDILLGSGLTGQALPTEERGNPLLVAVSDGADSGDVRRGVESALADRPDLRVVSPTTYVRGLITEVDAFLGVAGGLLGLSLLIAFLGIINTLTISVTERLREIGLLRAVGMSRGQVGAMVCTESLVLAALGGLLGLLTGTVLGAMAQHLVLTRPVTELTIPLPTVALCLVGLVTGALVAAIWPAHSAAQANILEAVTPE